MATDLAAYRVIQEALTNVIRHAGARQVRVELHYGDATLTLRVTDDGRGAAGPRRWGERHRRHAGAGRSPGGRTARGPAPGGGYEVVARIPLPYTEEAGA